MKLPQLKAGIDENSLLNELFNVEQSAQSMCVRLFNSPIDQLTKDHISAYIKSDHFNNDIEPILDYEKFANSFVNVLWDLIVCAKENGFPNDDASIAKDMKLSATLYTSLIENEFDVTPADVNNSKIQCLMTLRVFPFLVYWRWFNNDRINPERLKYNRRNYFYTLWISAWFFDKGQGENRYHYLTDENSDLINSIIKAITERPGIGFRPAFAQALLDALIAYKNHYPDLNLEELLNKAMAKATFTFKVSVMYEDPDYYKTMVKYLLDWSKGELEAIN